MARSHTDTSQAYATCFAGNLLTAQLSTLSDPSFVLFSVAAPATCLPPCTMPCTTVRCSDIARPRIPDPSPRIGRAETQIYCGGSLHTVSLHMPRPIIATPKKNSYARTLRFQALLGSLGTFAVLIIVIACATLICVPNRCVSCFRLGYTCSTCF